MPTSKSSTAFEYRQPLPVGRDSTLHRSTKESILNSIIENSQNDCSLHFIYGPKYCGKTSLSNSIITILDDKYSKKFMTIPISLDTPESGALIASVCRQIFDKLLQSLIEEKIINEGDEVYLDWINKVDQTGRNIEVANGLRIGNLIANAINDPTKDNLIGTTVLDSDFRRLQEMVKKKRSDFKKFILFFDDFGRFKETAVEKTLFLLTKCSKIDICINSNSSYREYWDLNHGSAGISSLDYPLKEPTEEDVYILFFVEMKHLNAPNRIVENIVLNDIYETANKEFRNFLIICHLIWQEIRAGRLEKFEINSWVLNGLISIAKKDSAPETIKAIEGTMKSSLVARMNRIEVLEVLAYKSLDLRDITVLKNLPDVLDEESLNSQMLRYENALKAFTDKGLLIKADGTVGHSGLGDSVVESYVRFQLRDEIRREKKRSRYFLADDTYENLMLAVFRRDFIYRVLRPHSVTHSSAPVEIDESVSWDLLDMVRDRDIFSIYAEQTGRNFEEALGQDNDRFGVLLIRCSIRGKQQILMVSVMMSLRPGMNSLDDELEKWKTANDKLLTYLEFEIIDFSYELLGEEETQDLQALHKSRDTKSGMSAFRNRNYALSRDEFVKQYQRIDILLAKYRPQFEVKKSERTALLREIADLKMRLAFTDLLVGNIDQAIETLLAINEEHLEDDISIWIYRDDLANAFAFKHDYTNALQFSNRASYFFESNIGFLPPKRGASLLQFIPDGKFGESQKESEISRYHYESEEDPTNCIPVMLNLYLQCKLDLFDKSLFIDRLNQLLLDRGEVPEVTPLRSALWFLRDLLGEEGVNVLKSALIRHRIPRDTKSKLLFDDLSNISGNV